MRLFEDAILPPDADYLEYLDSLPEDDECPSCKGRGTVNPLTAPRDFFCTGTTDCPDCDGTGRML